jgi:hypothetical protein
MTRRIWTFAAFATLSTAIIAGPATGTAASAAPGQGVRPHTVDRVITKTIDALGTLEHPGGSLDKALSSYRSASRQLADAADRAKRAGLPGPQAHRTAKRLQALSKDLAKLADCFEMGAAAGSARSCLATAKGLKDDAFGVGLAIGRLARYSTLTPRQIQRQLIKSLG